MNLSPAEETMPEAAVEEGKEILARWAGIFPGANTWVAKEHGVPSLFVRLDCVVDSAGRLRIYEIEERPCGMGITMRVNPHFALRLTELKRRWPQFRSVKSDTRPTDDELWLGEPLSLAEAREHDGLLLVRSRPEEDQFHCLEDRAVSSVSEEGNKSYGETFGWWHPVTARPDDEPGSFYLEPAIAGPSVIKPRRGTRSRFVSVYVPKTEREQLRQRIVFGSGECQGIAQIEKLVARQPNRAMYCQPLIEPMRLPHQPDFNCIYRFFYGFDPEKGQWVPLGGVWMGLDALIVHGTDRTVTGPLRF